jgi:L-iditol 2-dehydrogenase
LNISGAWSWNGRDTWERAIDLIQRGVFDLESLITNRYRLDEWELAFENLRSRQDVKALLYPNGLEA